MPQSLPTLCGSIMGSPFSLSAKIHNAAYAALGLDYTFVCFGIEDPVAGVAAIRALGVRGMNVSMPYKTVVMEHLTRSMSPHWSLARSTPSITSTAFSPATTPTTWVQYAPCRKSANSTTSALP